jgi:prepilin-type N-terminal cleavage/methylation domain-containing protein
MTSVKTNKKGFTLVELVVVIAILAILAAIAIPVVNSIINTASKNGALSNAQTIELAVKEAQSNIASKNTEVYNGGKKKDAEGNDADIWNAKSDHDKISMYTVAVAKGIEDAFDQATYNGVNYFPCWNNNSAKCIFVGKDGSDTKTIDGETVTIGTDIFWLAGSDSSDSKGKYKIANGVKIDSIKTEAVTTTPAPATP